MQYTLDDGKTIYISDREIKNSMEKLDITYQEAVVLWLEDNGYQENNEQDKLEQKAKDNRITATIHQARADKPKAKKSREKKIDLDRQELITILQNALAESVTDITIPNDQKEIEFKYKDKWYGVSLRFNRTKQKKESQ